MNKKIFSTSPYKAGASGSNTMVMVIPAPIVKYHKIDTSTIFLVRSELDRIVIEKVNFSEEKKMAVDEGVEAYSQ